MDGICVRHTIIKSFHFEPSSLRGLYNSLLRLGVSVNRHILHCKGRVIKPKWAFDTEPLLKPLKIEVARFVCTVIGNR